MAKSEIISRIGFVLNRGWGNPDVFVGKKQDAMVKLMAAYFEAHQPLLGAVKVTHGHGLNDRGVDFLIEVSEVKAGFQIKTETDVVKEGFAADVKRQITESLQHGLDKYYLLICTPLTVNNKDYSGRINHLISELSTMKTKYLAVYSPESAAKYFDGTRALNKLDLELEHQQFGYEATNEDLLAKAIAALEQKSISAAATAPAERFEEKRGSTGAAAVSLDGMKQILGWQQTPEEQADSVADINDLRSKLIKLPVKVRDILVTCVRYSKTGKGADSSQSAVVPAAQVEGMLGLDSRQLVPQLKLLENAKLVYVDVEEGNEAKFVVRWRESDWGIFNDLREFTDKAGVDLAEILVHCNMSLLD